MTDASSLPPQESGALALPWRGLLRVAGEDRRSFLQGLISNDVEKATPERTLWSAFLTAQGKFLHEFFLAESEETLLLEGEAERLDDLKRRLSLYRLRSKATVEDAREDFAVAAFYGPEALEALGLPGEPGATRAFCGGLVFVDPRQAALGARAIVPRGRLEEALAETGLPEGSLEGYDRLRIALGVPDGTRDLEVEKTILLEAGFDELHGIDWGKGCYMGQELTARTRYRGLVKKRLVPLAFEGEAPAPGTEVAAEGKPVGEIRSVAKNSEGGIALAQLRLDALAADKPLQAGGLALTPRLPSWLKLAEPASS